MKKSKSVIIFIVFLVVIVLITSFIFVFQRDKTDRVLNMYNKIKDSQNFTFTMEEVNSETQYKISISQRGTDTNIDMQTANEHTSTLIVEGHVYFIMHDEQEYYTYDSDNTDGDIILGGLKDISDKEYIHGTEEIFGKSYYYEEFEDISTFMILLDLNEDSKVKTRFYFDGDEIAYIKNIVSDNGEEQEELLKVTLEYSVDDSLFEIPSEYAEM